MPSTAAARTRASIPQGTATWVRSCQPSYATWSKKLQACSRKPPAAAPPVPSEPERQTEPESPAWLWCDLKSGRAWPNAYPTLRAYAASCHSDEDPHSPPDQRATLSTTGITAVAAAAEGEVAQEVSEPAHDRSGPRAQQPAADRAQGEVGCMASPHLHERHAVVGQRHDPLPYLRSPYVIRNLHPEGIGVLRDQHARIGATTCLHPHAGAWTDGLHLSWRLRRVLGEKRARHRQAGGGHEGVDCELNAGHGSLSIGTATKLPASGQGRVKSSAPDPLTRGRRCAYCR